MHVDATIGFAGDGAADDVHDGQGAVAAAFRLAQGGQCVGSLAGLRDDEQDGIALERRVAIAELVGEFDFDGDMGEFLDEILAHESGVPARAAGGDDDALDGAQRLG